MLKLNLIRHAKTNQESPTGRDFDRELLPKGIMQANMLAVYLDSNAIDLGTVLCSGAKRTRQTWHILEQHVFPGAKASFSEDLYLANYPTMMSCIQEQTTKTITVIGHNEGISELASYLSGQTGHLKTCGFIQLTAELDNWDQLIRDSMSIADQFRPEVAFP
jgi:phosphohistidine phosphatase